MEIFQDGELEEEMRKRDFQANSLSSVWHLFSSSYQEAIKSLTCPVRATYSAADLGPKEFFLDGANPEDSSSNARVIREDLQLLNSRDEVLECSFWRRASSSPTSNPTSKRATPPAPAPCIVYLHGMSSSRKECVYLRHKVLAAGFSLFALDLSGSGLSEGDHMSFGHYEKDDLRTVLDYLFATGRASAVGVWGRCIGGATALLHLRDALEYNYKVLTLSKRDASRLQLARCKQTGQLLCVRPGRVFPFRVTQLSASNGDFVVLSIGKRMVNDMDAAACKQLIQQSPDEPIEIAGFEHLQGVLPGRPTQFVFALALDSTYGDMEKVIADMLSEVGKSAEKRKVSFPSTMMTAASKIISHSVRKTAGFQLKDVAVLEDVGAFRLPCLFVSTTKVDFIRPEHNRAIYDRYGGAKEWLTFDGVHDQNRPEQVVDALCSHFVTRWKQT